MAGGTLTGGGLLTNNTTGTFSGYGTINANAGFSNYGTMTLTGGTSTVNGTYTNQSGGQLNIFYDTATFNGDVNNYGNIKVNGSPQEMIPTLSGWLTSTIMASMSATRPPKLQQPDHGEHGLPARRGG